LRLKRETVPGLAFAATTIALRLSFLGLPFDAHDEGYYAAVAKETVRGSRLYADLWYMRPPLLNSVYAGSYRFSLGTRVPYDLSVRLLAGLFAALTVGIVARALFAEFSPRAAFLGSAFAALAGASLTLQNEANAETWMLLPYTLSALLLLQVALREPPFRRAAWTVLLAGALTGIAAAFKQVALVNLALPAVAWVVFDRPHVRRWLGLTAAFIGGTLFVWAGILVRLVMNDELRAFLYFAWFRNAVYVKYSHAELEPMLLLVRNLTGLGFAFTITAALTLALFGAALLRRDGSQRRRKIALFAFGWLFLSAIGISASGRFYMHYFIQATIPLALLLSASADEFLADDLRERDSSTAIAVVLVLALLSPLVSLVIDAVSIPFMSGKRGVYKDLGTRLSQFTVPGGSVLVWGICASVKAYCPLPSATRLPVVYDDYSWSPQSPGNLMGEAFPSTGDAVLADMHRSAPDTLVLTAPLGSDASNAPGSRYGPGDGGRLKATLYSTITKEYEVVERSASYVVLRRKR
jgi:4-amino-4-deoxy-L-arabinose transferase-like glycosyltransferase